MPPSEPVTLAVLPLANLSGDAAQELTRYKGTQKDASEIGRELGVAYLVEGGVWRVGERIRVSATLVKTADSLQVWSEGIDARLDDVFEVQERVAARIVEALHVRLSPAEADSLRRWGTRNAAAYDEYLRGWALVTRYNRRENIEAARGHFERALRMDPAFAPAMVGLAFVEAATYRDFDSAPGRLTRARALLERALEIDPRAPRALDISAIIRAASYDYRGAAEEFLRAAALDPRDHSAWDGACWALGYLTPPEAVEADRACRRALELNPGFVEAEYHLAKVLVQQGRIADAEHVIGRLAEHAPDSPFLYGARFWVHLASNRPNAAIEALEAQPGFVTNTAVARAWMSMALAQAGDLDRAFAALETALAKGYRDTAGLLGDPYFEPLRRDPRFAQLLAGFGVASPTSAPVRAVGSNR